MKKHIYNKRWFKTLILTLLITLISLSLSCIAFDYCTMESEPVMYNGFKISLNYIVIIVQHIIVIPAIIVVASLIFNKYDFESKLNLIPYVDGKITLEPENENPNAIVWKEQEEWLDKVTFSEFDKGKNVIIINSEKYNREYYISYNEVKNLIPAIKHGRIIGYFIAEFDGKYVTVKLTKQYTKRKNKHE